MRELFVIDAHMHLGAPWALYTHGWETADILRLMDRLSINRAYSMHHMWLGDRFAETRDASLKAYDESGGRFPFMAVFDPRSEKESIAIMDACLGHEGFICIKIHPSFHATPANDASYEPVWAYASEHKLPIMSHTWSDTYNPSQKLSLPKLFEPHIEKYPDVVFVAGHAGGPGKGQYEVIELIRNYPNVYLDTSGDVFFLNLIEDLIDAVGAERVIFGTDQPWVDPRANLTRVFLADISDEARALVLRKNALSVYEPHLLAMEE